MAIVKSNYVKRGKGERGRAKATVRYITHRRDRDNQTVTRKLFGFDGELTREQAYRMIDEAQKGTLFYRFVLSPDPKREDRYKDLGLSDITTHTMLKLEERLGRQVQFCATEHIDHSPHRHVHVLALVGGRKLTREDLQALRHEATERALFQRRMRDRIREHTVMLKRGRYSGLKRFAFRGSKPYQSYTCPLCGYHQALPYSASGYRCPADGWYLRRDKSYGFEQTRQRERGMGLELSLSP
jgi:hypothetical protein